MFFFCVPGDITMQILIDWLTPESVVAFDSALCNKLTRSFILQIFCDKSFVVNELDEHLLIWCVRRSIKTQQLSLSRIFTISFPKTFSDTVKSLKLSFGTVPTISLTDPIVKSINSFTNLKCLSFEHDCVSTIDILQYVTSSTFAQLSVLTLRSGVTSSSLLFLSEVCFGLSKLNLKMDSTKCNSASICKLLHVNNQLQIVEIDYNGVGIDIISTAVHCIPQLECFDLDLATVSGVDSTESWLLLEVQSSIQSFVVSEMGINVFVYCARLPFNRIIKYLDNLRDGVNLNVDKLTNLQSLELIDVALSSTVLRALLQQNSKLVCVDLTLYNDDVSYALFDIFRTVVSFPKLENCRIRQSKLKQTFWYLNSPNREVRLVGDMGLLTLEQLSPLQSLLKGFETIILHGFSYLLLTLLVHLYENNPNVSDVEIQLCQLESSLQCIRTDCMNVLQSHKLKNFLISDFGTKQKYLSFNNSSNCIVRGGAFMHTWNSNTNNNFRQVATLIDPCESFTNFMGLLVGFHTISMCNCLHMENYLLTRLLTYNPHLSALEIRLGKITKQALFDLMHNYVNLKTVVLHDCDFGVNDLIFSMHHTKVKYIAVIGISMHTKVSYCAMELANVEIPRICFRSTSETIMWIEEVKTHESTSMFVDRAFW
jgi:hypothetical protein